MKALGVDGKVDIKFILNSNEMLRLNLFPSR